MKRKVIRFWQCPRCGHKTVGPTHTARVTQEEVCYECAVRENLTAMGLRPESQDRILAAMYRARDREQRAARRRRETLAVTW